ncbi:MAG: lamin tail domain-containing protein [Chloroflexi bacterium]|nr:lamin tail domain-containing protein [Chloroflexota bacterium]
MNTAFRCLLLLAILPLLLLGTPSAAKLADVTPIPSILIYMPITQCGHIGGPSDLRIADILYDQTDEIVTIENRGGPQAMAGWRLLSVVGSQTYYFPADCVIPALGRVRIHSGPDAIDVPPLDLFWTRSYIWRNAGDEAILYDADGQQISRWRY